MQVPGAPLVNRSPRIQVKQLKDRLKSLGDTAAPSKMTENTTTCESIVDTTASQECPTEVSASVKPFSLEAKRKESLPLRIDLTKASKDYYEHYRHPTTVPLSPKVFGEDFILSPHHQSSKDQSTSRSKRLVSKLPTTRAVMLMRNKQLQSPSAELMTRTTMGVGGGFFKPILS